MWDGFSTRLPPEGAAARGRGRVENPSHIKHTYLWIAYDTLKKSERSCFTKSFDGVSARSSP